MIFFLINVLVINKSYQLENNTSQKALFNNSHRSVNIHLYSTKPRYSYASENCIVSGLLVVNCPSNSISLYSFSINTTIIYKVFVCHYDATICDK